MPKVTGNRRPAKGRSARTRANTWIGLKERIGDVFARVAGARETAPAPKAVPAGTAIASWIHRRSRPTAFWRQIDTGTLPVGPAISACAAFYLMVGAYGVAIGGHMDPRVIAIGQSIAQATTLSGLKVNEIEVTGLSEEFRRGEVLAAMQIGYGEPIVWLDTSAARKRVENLPWIRSATVMRLLPEKLSVSITERIPYAVWQINGRRMVIDKDGIVIADETDGQYAGLPLVVGAGANEEALDFLSELAQWPGVQSRLLAAVRVAERRWNLRLLNGIDIRLPEKGASSALDEVAALDDAYGLLSRDITAVDFRVADRITIRLSDEAALRRDAALKGQNRGHERRGGET